MLRGSVWSHARRGMPGGGGGGGGSHSARKSRSKPSGRPRPRLHMSWPALRHLASPLRPLPVPRAGA
eukprot:3596631-Pyramimonas_sp.AAC.1